MVLPEVRKVGRKVRKYGRTNVRKYGRKEARKLGREGS